MNNTELPITINEEERQALPVFIGQLPQDVQDKIENLALKMFADYTDESIVSNIMDSKIIDILSIFETEAGQHDEVFGNEIIAILKQKKQIPFTYKVEVFETSEGATGELLPQTDAYNITPFLDEAEDECFNLFKAYASCAGIEFDEDSEIDYRIAKEISEKFIDMVETTFGRKFPLNAQEESQDNEDMDYDR